MIGYALGRVEDDETRLSVDQNPSYVGHIASLAVYKQYRGQGVAQNLMKNLHHNFVEAYDVDTVSLYCRVSNQAAFNLYSSALSYKCHKVVPGYYEDKENAYMMTLSDLGSQLKGETGKMVTAADVATSTSASASSESISS